jgi:hypothetical protein
MGGSPEIPGADAVANTFKGRAQAAKPAIVDGMLGIPVVIHGHLRIVLRLTIANGKIAAIEAIADPERLGRLDVKILSDGRLVKGEGGRTLSVRGRLRHRL